MYETQKKKTMQITEKTWNDSTFHMPAYWDVISSNTAWTKKNRYF